MSTQYTYWAYDRSIDTLKLLPSAQESLLSHQRLQRKYNYLVWQLLLLWCRQIKHADELLKKTQRPFCVKVGTCIKRMRGKLFLYHDAWSGIGTGRDRRKRVRNRKRRKKKSRKKEKKKTKKRKYETWEGYSGILVVIIINRKNHPRGSLR